MYSSNCDSETRLSEINLRKRKWLLNGSYKRTKSEISHHLECLNSILEEIRRKYENYGFFCSLNGLKNLINKRTCYKNSEKPKNWTWT